MVAARFAFEELGLHRLQVAIIPRNRASRRVAEKLELREEGIAHRYLAINGVWEDHIRYALTAEDWTNRRQELLDTWVGERPGPTSTSSPGAERPQPTDSPSGRRGRRRRGPRSGGGGRCTSRCSPPGR